MENKNRVKEFLKKHNLADNYLEFEASTATVSLAALAIGCEEGRIVKTLSFKLKEGVIVVLTCGTARIDNQKFKSVFKQKASFLKAEEVEPLTGHPVGGVCPFALKEGVSIYLDESLKNYNPAYPAAGAANNAVKITLADLEKVTQGKWVDVCSSPVNI